MYVDTTEDKKKKKTPSDLKTINDMVKDTKLTADDFRQQIQYLAIDSQMEQKYQNTTPSQENEHQDHGSDKE